MPIIQHINWNPPFLRDREGHPIPSRYPGTGHVYLNGRDVPHATELFAVFGFGWVRYYVTDERGKFLIDDSRKEVLKAVRWGFIRWVPNATLCHVPAVPLLSNPTSAVSDTRTDDLSAAPIFVGHPANQFVWRRWWFRR